MKRQCHSIYHSSPARSLCWRWDWWLRSTDQHWNQSTIIMFELTSSRFLGWMFAGDIRVKAGQHKMAPFEYECREWKTGYRSRDGAIATKRMKWGKTHRWALMPQDYDNETWISAWTINCLLTSVWSWLAFKFLSETFRQICLIFYIRDLLM